MNVTREMNKLITRRSKLYNYVVAVRKIGHALCGATLAYAALGDLEEKDRKQLAMISIASAGLISGAELIYRKTEPRRFEKAVNDIFENPEFPWDDDDDDDDFPLPFGRMTPDGEIDDPAEACNGEPEIDEGPSVGDAESTTPAEEPEQPSTTGSSSEV